MSLLPLELPTIQNWSCHNCGGCCRQHAIEISADEHRRIVEQGWTGGQDGIPAGQPVFVRTGPPWNRRYRLAHQPDGACVFLDERGLCRIHARFGEPAKPLACRLYPYAFHPAGKKVAVSLRFSCPSVVANKGRPVSAQKQDLRLLESQVVPEGSNQMPPPRLGHRQSLDWPDTLRAIRFLSDLVGPDDNPIALRLQRALFIVELLGQATFNKVKGSRLDEFLEILRDATWSADESDSDSEPTRTGQTQFRLLAAQYARKDTFSQQNAGWRRRFLLLRAAFGFARGRGLTTPLQAGFNAVPFADLEQPFGPLPSETDEIFTRYFQLKIAGLHFCGVAYYGIPIVEGFQSLSLVYPVTLWIARWLAASAGRRTLENDDVIRALAIVDHHHGFSPAFGQRTFRSRVRLLQRLGDISRLIAWYSR